ncbi:hypothetical protein PanWU01x14_290700 [Parasponia andersonii]|uniref:Uncharacterized protein n=1 Tax=Parasponia andersonii TaxID=3476 RepID=A0A2P5AXN5_PARAD|nr:hypothetical protein PanWU01x14_290700 [Parasponia andersonii]
MLPDPPTMKGKIAKNNNKQPTRKWK